MYKLAYTKRFQKDLQRCERRGWKVSRLYDLIKILQETGSVPLQ